MSGFPREGRGQDPWRGSWGDHRVCGPCPRQHVESRPGFWSYWEVWVWPMALPEGTFQNHSLSGARLKVRLRNSRPAMLSHSMSVHIHSTHQHTHVPTLAVAPRCCPGVPRRRGLELPVGPTPHARQPPPCGPVIELRLPRGLGKLRGPLGQPPLTPNANLRAYSPLVCV